MDRNRAVEFILEGVFAPVSVKLNGQEASWRYEGKALALHVSVPQTPGEQGIVLECTFPEQDTEILRGKKGLMHRMMDYTPVLKDVANTSIDPYKLLSRPFLKLAQCASHIDANPAGALQFLQNIDVEAVKEDLEQEAKAQEATDRADAAQRAARIRAALGVILAQTAQ